VAAACQPAAPAAIPADDLEPIAEQLGPPAAAPLGFRPRLDPSSLLRHRLTAALADVAAQRGLAVKRAVRAQQLDRRALAQRIALRDSRQISRATLLARGELLAALGLLPPDFELLTELRAHLESRVRGFYDPDSETLFLAADLAWPAAEETLVHELSHALQDQHFDLAQKLGFQPGDGDGTAALLALAEGDATAATLDVLEGPAFTVSPAALAEIAGSAGAATGPPVLRAAASSTYVDGFRFVQSLRQQGGWPAVNAAWRRPPATTEQLLHLDKYRTAEPAKPIAPPALPPPDGGEDWQLDDVSVVGEQSLRTILGQWAGAPAAAARAAAGWGGDRALVAHRDDGAERQVVVGWALRFDTAADAAELASLIQRAYPRRCTERPSRGALAWVTGGDAVVIAAGPARRDRITGARLLPAPPSCQSTAAWARDLLRQAAASGSASPHKPSAETSPRPAEP